MYLYTEHEEEIGGRLMTCFLYVRSCEGDNHYAHPLDLFIHLDMTAKKVLHDRSFMHSKVVHLTFILSGINLPPQTCTDQTYEEINF